MSKRFYEKDSIHNQRFVTNRGNLYYKKRGSSKGLSERIENTSLGVNRQINCNGQEIIEENQRKILQVIEEQKEKNLQLENMHEQNRTNKKKGRFIEEQILKQEERKVENNEKNKNILKFNILKDEGLRKREVIRYQQFKRNIILFEYIKKGRENRMQIQNQSDIDEQQRRESIKSNITDISAQICEMQRE